MTKRLHAALTSEAEAFHRAFFGDSAAPEVIERYVAANVRCFGESALDPVTTVAIDAGIDVEAVELVLRHRGHLRLTQKVQILFYLAEVRRSHLRFFATQEEGLTTALLGLAGSGLRSGWKYLKGWYLVRRHRLV